MTGPDLSHIAGIAERLSGLPVEALAQVGGGRNSRVFRVDARGQRFALKQYPSRNDDPRDRLATEVGALRLMDQHGMNTVPRVIETDAASGFALLSWIDGTPIEDVGALDIDRAVAFLAQTHRLRDTPWAVEQPLAAEACLSGVEIERQILARLNKLRAIGRDEPELVDFVDNCFSPVFSEKVEKCRAQRAKANLAFGAELPQKARSLVPSDFGFHNSLRLKDGSLAFLDFEYFGWDDPVKLTADIMLHPGRELSPQLQDHFRLAATKVYGGDSDFASRLASFYPLFGLRWALILLNEFIPDRWRRRVLAGATEHWSVAKSRQLSKARKYLKLVSDGAGN